MLERMHCHRTEQQHCVSDEKYFFDIVMDLLRMILNAVLNAILERNEAADLFFETVTSEDGENVVGWALYGKKRELPRTCFSFRRGSI